MRPQNEAKRTKMDAKEKRMLANLKIEEGAVDEPARRMVRPLTYDGVEVGRLIVPMTNEMLDDHRGGRRVKWLNSLSMLTGDATIEWATEELRDSIVLETVGTYNQPTNSGLKAVAAYAAAHRGNRE